MTAASPRIFGGTPPVVSATGSAAAVSASPIRVLFVAHDSGMYGAQRCLVDLLSGLDRCKVMPYVAAPFAGPFTEIAERLEVPVRLRHIRRWVVPYSEAQPRARLLTNFLRDLRNRVWAICHLVEQWGIDVVYTNTVTLAEGAIAARLMNRPHIWHLHEVLNGNRELKPILPNFVIERSIKALSKTIIVNSNFTARKFSLPPGDKKYRTVYNGIDIAQVERDAALPVTQPASPFVPGFHYVAIVGAIHPRKGIATFLSAANLLLQRIPNVVFLVIGGGRPDYVAAMKDLARQAGIESKVRFLGWRTDILALLSRCSLLVVSADQEPFGLTVIEAMSVGVPVVATRCGGPEEIIDDGATGVLVAPKSPEAIAEAAAAILRDPALHMKLAAAARLAVSTRFALRRYVYEIEDAILSAAR